MLFNVNPKGIYIMSNSIAVTKMSIRELLAAPSTANEFFEFQEYYAARSSLNRRMDMQIAKIRFLQKENLIDTDTTYLKFTNLRGTVGGTFDDTVIVRKSDDVELGTFCFQTWGHVKGGNAYYTISDEKFDFEDWKSMKQNLKDDETLREKIRAQFNPDYVEPEVEPEVVKVKTPKTKKIKTEDVIDEQTPEDDIDAHIPEKRSRRKPKVEVEQTPEVIAEDIIE